MSRQTLPEGFYIKELRITGQNKEDAYVEFLKGYNLVTGPSDTGKSYLYSAIDFMLGGSTPPKPIPESRGYGDIYMEIATYDSENCYTIHRSISESEVHIKECSIGQYDRTGSCILEKTNKKGYEDLSRFLFQLSVSNSDIKIKKSYSKVINLTYPWIRNLFSISENQVISEKSPFIPNNQYAEQTLYKALLKYLVSGQDSSNFTPQEKREIKKARLLGQKTFCEEQIERINEEIEELNKIMIESSCDITITLSQLEEKLVGMTENVAQYTEQKNSIYNEICICESEISFYRNLIKKLQLLQKHYVSDLNRLEFVYEGHDLFNQLNTINCPVCDSPFNITSWSRVEADVAPEESIHMEKEKIRDKCNDLGSTIVENQKHLAGKEQDKNHLEKDYQEVSHKIECELSPQILEVNNEIAKVREGAEKEAKIALLTDNITFYIEKIEMLDRLLKAKAPTQTAESIDTAGISEYKDYISNYLTSWNYPYGDHLVYNEEETDFKLLTKQRGHHGKGMRGISYTAVIIALVDYCIAKNVPFTKLLVVDSPLTTYHGKNAAPSIDDHIDDNIQDAFFSSLADKDFKFQFIMLDNKMPSLEVQSKINFIEFTEDKNNGRYGFFPLVSEDEK